MAASSAKSLPTVGFISVCQQSDRSLVGGYLLLNATGRPVEFHCTAPVRPSRAHEILYGPTLKSFLYGEQIAKALISKASSQPLFVCTDSDAVLTVRDLAATPVILVRGQDDAPSESPRGAVRVDPAHAVPAPSAALVWFSLGTQSAAVSTAHAKDRDTVRQRWQHQIEGLDLCEPFTRIREAIEEAQRTAAR
jgi:hypothetical protein